MTIVTYDPLKPRFPDVSEYHPVVDWDLLAAQSPPLFVFKVGNGDVSPDPMSDPKWKFHLDGAESHGLIAGGYWYSDPQVDAFLAAFPPKEGRIPILDFEGNAQVARSEAFVTTLHKEWGRWPWFYGHSLWINQGQPEGTAIANCPYWGATYGNDLSVPRGVGPVAAWQFTDGVFGASGSPRSYQGVSGPCDISMLVESTDDVDKQAGHVPPEGGKFMGIEFKDMDDFETHVRIALGGQKKGSTDSDLAYNEIRHALRGLEKVYQKWCSETGQTDIGEFGDELYAKWFA